MWLRFLFRHETIIFPDIPKPQLIFKDIMNNNKEPKVKKTFVYNKCQKDSMCIY